MDDGAAPAAPAVGRWLASLSVLAGTFMVVLDSTVVNVALPHIAGSLSATVDEATWVLTSYLAANAIILPITGWLADYFGRKRLLLTAVTASPSASLLCGLAPSLPVLIFFRVVQGTDRRRACSPSRRRSCSRRSRRASAARRWRFWAVGHRRGADPRPGPRRLAHRQLLLALDLLHQHAGRAGRARDDPGVHLRPGLHPPPDAASIDYWGIGMLAVGVGALQIVLDKGQEEDWFSSHLIIVLHRRCRRVALAAMWCASYGEAADRGSARIPLAHLCRRRVADDADGLRALPAAWCCCRCSCRR